MSENSNKLLDSVSLASKERLRDLFSEKTTRRISALRMYTAMKAQQDFHESRASERIVRGGNRSGKSMCAFAETARAATGTDPYGKYPTDRPLLIWIICYEEGQIGRTAHRMLFRAGAFKMIKDAETEEWRAYRPDDPVDMARHKEAKPAPPLISPRIARAENFAWKDKGRRIFSVVRLFFGEGHPMNGTEIHAFSSGAEPPMGDPVDVIHIDEDLKYDRHVAEFQARLSDNKGRLIWSVFPYSRNDALIQMSKRAEDEVNDKDPDVAEFRLTFSGNPHIDADEKRKRLKGWTPEEAQARDLGEFLLDSILVYPEFHIETHGLPRRLAPGEAVEDLPLIDQLFTKTRVPPPDWTRYAIIDPGISVCAVLFVAVPPPEYGDHVVAYDELYMKNCDPNKFGIGMLGKCQTQFFRAFLIDEHGSRVRSAHSSKTVKHLYSMELRRHRIASDQTKHGFISGSDDVQGGIVTFRMWLTTREEGTQRFKVVRNMCPELEHELSNYKKRIVDRDIKDEPVQKKNHLCDDCRYIAMYDPKYVKPRRVTASVSSAVRAFRRWQSGEKKRSGERSILLGPTTEKSSSNRSPLYY